MNNILYTTFANPDDGIRAAEALLLRGIRPEDISLVLPKTQPTCPAQTNAPSEGDMAVTVKSASVPHFASAVEATIDLSNPPELPPWPRNRAPHYYGNKDIMAAGASGYHYDALGAVILDPVPQRTEVSPSNNRHEVTVGAEEGAGLGIGLGLLTALCIPGIGLLTGAGVLVMGLMAGSIAGGIYGYLMDCGVARGIAQVMSNHLEAGGTALSVTMPDAQEETMIVRILEMNGGHVIRQS